MTVRLYTTLDPATPTDRLLKALGKPSTQPVHTTDDEPSLGPWAPRELTRPAFLPPRVPPRAVLCAPAGPAPEYAAPEPAPGAPADVWALACTAFELRTGAGLFDAGVDEVLPDAPAVGPLRRRLARALGLDVDAELRARASEALAEALPGLLAGGRNVADTRELLMAQLELDENDADAVLPALRARGMREPQPAGVRPYVGPLLAWEGARMAEAERVLFHDLLGKMLRYAPEERIAMPEVLAHEWFTYKGD
jgi:serine/threonine protein kinase